MYNIGISAYYHESSVFLTDNRGTNCFLKEESFSRIKGDKNFPKRSLKFLIKKFELKKENQIEINAIPTECKNENLENIFDEILQQEKNDEKLKVSSKERIAKVLAKSLAIKSGKKLEMQEISLLVNNLFACNLPTVCPNGNPTIINITFNDISKHF